jgi:RNA polymerase sigma factor (sigma-70 family)
MTGIVEYIRRAVPPRNGAGASDRELLGEYVGRRDEAALSALVSRHGPMVWGVCRRVLGNHHDAEDAFQATFLVLVRKAASIASRDLLANWLYGVAYQTARKARATATKRKSREKQVMDMPDVAAREQDLWDDIQPVLDHELSRLPDAYRAVVILCDLQGKSRKEAARQLRCPEGTVMGRLARARAKLAQRLRQRGVVLSGGALAAVVSHRALAGVPPTVVSSTVKVASQFGAAGVVISGQVAALAEGVLKAMLFTKLKVATAIMVVAIAVAGSGGLLYQTQAAQPTATQSQEDDQPSLADIAKQIQHLQKTVDDLRKEVKQLKGEMARHRTVPGQSAFPAAPAIAPQPVPSTPLPAGVIPALPAAPTQPVAPSPAGTASAVPGLAPVVPTAPTVPGVAPEVPPPAPAKNKRGH